MTPRHVPGRFYAGFGNSFRLMECQVSITRRVSEEQ